MDSRPGTALERAAELLSDARRGVALTGAGINTDGLHQDSGVRRVIELHGSGRTTQCLVGAMPSSRFNPTQSYG